ncbi:retrovirus-related Pol polyprotein from transposon opus [Trichonephila clavipes]|nr:retrovirus-related Pol polyprotein from transposon opus [Trichonephila clavipes]
MAYYQIPIAEEDKEKNCHLYPIWLVQVQYYEFWTEECSSPFQRFITEVLYGLDFVLPYLDDVLVALSTEEEHSEHLKMVFERFQQYGIRINVSKSVTGAAQLNIWDFDHGRRFSATARKSSSYLKMPYPELNQFLEINFDAIAEEQTIDEELQQLLQDNSRKFKPSTLPSGKELWCDISTQKIRPYIPQKFRFQMFQLIHGLAHPGIKTAVKLMTEKYVWSDIKKQIRELAKACIRCQKCKVSRHTKSKLGEFEQPDESGQVIYSQFGLAIHQNDHQARRRFGEWAQNEIAVVPDFHKRILFSDEAHFWLNGYVNKQNCRIWSEANPQVYVETPLHPEKLTVWCASWAGGILLQKR